jgi:hypothetical protein
MLFKQSELSSSLDEATSLLEDSMFLNESESSYHPYMIPIRESKEYDANIVKIEDLVEYSMANGITDAQYAIDQVCEANDIDINTLAFSIDEVSAYYDEEMLDTALALKEAGAGVIVAPISRMDPMYQLTESVVDTMVECTGTEDEEIADALFEAFIMDDYDTVFSEAAIVDRIKSKGSAVKASVSAKMANAKKAASEKMASLREKMRALKERAKTLTGKAKEKCLAAIEKCKQGIAFIKQKISRKKEG